MKTLAAVIFFLICNPLFAQDIQPTITSFDYQRDLNTILERTKNKYDTLYYLKLLPRFQRNDTKLTHPEVLALLIGYTQSSNFKPYEDMEIEKKIIKLNDEGFYKDVLDESKKYLLTHPLSLSINKERSFAYNQLRRFDSARYFMGLADKIMEAMIFSGKGISPETAFFSLGLADGDYFVPNIGLTIWARKTGFDRNKNFLYIIDGVSLEDMHKNYYFNIQHAKSKMDQANNPVQPIKKVVPQKGKGKKKQEVPIVDTIPYNPADEILPMGSDVVLAERDSIARKRRADSIVAAKIRADSIIRSDSIAAVILADSIFTAKLKLDSLAVSDSIAKKAKADYIAARRAAYANKKKLAATKGKPASVKPKAIPPKGIKKPGVAKPKPESVISADSIGSKMKTSLITATDSLERKLPIPDNPQNNLQSDKGLLVTDSVTQNKVPETTIPATDSIPVMKPNTDSVITNKVPETTIPATDSIPVMKPNTDSVTTNKVPETIIPATDSIPVMKPNTDSLEIPVVDSTSRINPAFDSLQTPAIDSVNTNIDSSANPVNNPTPENNQPPVNENREASPANKEQ